MKLTLDRLVTLFGLLVIFGIALTVVWFGFFYPSTPAQGQPYPGPGAISGKPTTPTPFSPRLQAVSVPTSTQNYLPVIAYSPPPCFSTPDGIGLERYYLYQSFQLSDRLSLYVNLWNGNLTAQYDEFGIPSRGLPLAFNHTFNDCANLVSPNYGLNWTINLAARVISSSNQAILYDGDGTKVVFASNAGAWNAPAGVFDTLTGTGPFTLTHKDQSQQIFDLNDNGTWRAAKIQDRFQNAITLTYTSNQLTRVTAAGGQAITLTYNVTNQLNTVTNDAGQAFTFHYNGNLLTWITDPLSQTTIFTYTGSNLATIADPRGVQTALDYDEYQRLKTIFISTTQVATFTYGSGVTTFADGNNHPTSFYLNGTGQVTQSVQALDSQTFYTSSFFYDGGYNVIATTDPLGRHTYAQYDGKGNVLSQTNALTQTTTYSYTAQNDLLSVTDPLSRVTRYGYDAVGNLLVITDALTNTTNYGYNNIGQRTVVTDANSHATIYGYSPAGYLISRTDALLLAGTTLYSYDALGNRTTVTDALANITRYGYDKVNRLISTTVPLTVGLSATTQYGYDPVGNRTVLTDANGFATTFTYDALNRQTRTTDALGNATQSQYDPVGNQTKVIDANTHPITYTYDALNRLTSVVDAVSNTTSYGYDPLGNRTVVTDARQNSTYFGYDVLNRVVSTTIPLTGTATATTLYGYDAVGNRTVVTDANTHSTTYVYDRMNRVVNIVDAASHPITYTYDNVGNRLTQADAAGNAARYGYDALNRVVTVTSPSLKSQAYSYDSVGNRTAFTDELTQTTRYAYDAAHRLVAVTDPLTQTTFYGYDKVGNTLAVTQPNNLVRRVAYDNINRVLSQTNPIGTEQYAYDNVGNATIITGTAGTTRNFTYDSINRVTVEDNRDASQSTVVSYTFGYDSNSNRTSETEYRPAQTPLTTARAYDKANRLASVNDAYLSTTSYAYDAVGNQTSVTDPAGYTTSVTPNSLSQPQTTTLSNSSLGTFVTTTNTFDNRGLLTGTHTFDGLHALNVTTTLDFNPNGYHSSNNLNTQGAVGSRVLTSSLTYRDNNLVDVVTLGSATRNVKYDSAGRVTCWQYYPNGEYLEYDSSGRRSKLYSDYVPQCNGGDILRTFGYDGFRVISETMAGSVSPPFSYTRSYNYDAEGNLTQIQTILSPFSILTYTYSWEPGSHHLIGVNGVNNNGVSLVTETLRYDRLNRITRMCDGASCSSYRILAYVGDTDWLARVVNQDGVTLYEFQYANGRPLRVDSPYPPYYASSYFVFNWHGDGSGAVGSDGNYTNPWADWGAWGELDGSVDYYGAWNGAQGYLHFYGFNGGTDFSNGLYSVHGRWWNPATGLFMSPDDKGEYFYGSGQDAVNWVWAQFLSGGTYQFSKNNLDALSPAVNLLSPGSYQNYLDYSERIEASLPESLPFQAGRLFGTTVTLAQSFEEVTTVGPGLIVAGTGVTCLATGLETASVGCIAGAGASVVAGGAVIVHGLSVEAYSISNGYQILFAKGRGGRRFSVNQMDKEVQRGKAPPTIVRVDPPRAPFEKPNVHFIDGSALNSDGTWKHGSRVLTNAEKDWLSSWGWTLPDE